MKKGTKRLYNCIREHLKENELIYILRENEIVKSYWHEDGLCIILN